MNITTSGGRPTSLKDLRVALRQFASERDWDQFHSPKNLAMALSVEAAELLEHFQWALDPTRRGWHLTAFQRAGRDRGCTAVSYSPRRQAQYRPILAAATEKIQLNAENIQ